MFNRINLFSVTLNPVEKDKLQVSTDEPWYIFWLSTSLKMKTLITIFVSLIFTVIFHVNSSYQSWPEQGVAVNGNISINQFNSSNSRQAYDISRMIIYPLKINKSIIQPIFSNKDTDEIQRNKVEYGPRCHSRHDKIWNSLLEHNQWTKALYKDIRTLVSGISL